MQNRDKSSELELRWPRNGLKIGPRSSRGVRSAPWTAQTPNPPTNMWTEGAGGREIAKAHTPIRNPP
eukprot:4626192-Alexandrium_andersonii.AAC.1